MTLNGYVFRVGQRIAQEFNPKTKKEDSKVRNEEKQLINTLARGINARAKEEEDQLKQLAQLHPDPPPPLLLEKTGVAKEVEEYYKTNTRTGESGLTMFTPPPVLLAPLTEEEKQ